MAWRLAKSLETLRAEVNAFAPNRSKASDGTIGDPAHADRSSRHNPNDFGVVCALDLTHDPANGCDIHAAARRHVLRPHPELEYVISEEQVAKKSTGFRWEAYTGTNPHRLHAHFAVGVGPDSEPRPPYDSTTPWGIASASPAPTPGDTMTPEQEARILAKIGDVYNHISERAGAVYNHIPSPSAIADAVVAALPPSSGGGGLTKADIVAAVKQALTEGTV